MLSAKRKFGDAGLGRRVKARKEEDESDIEVESSDAPSEEEVGASEGSEEEDDSDVGSEEESDDEPAEKEPAVDFSSISFGDLAKAHAAISKKSKKAAAPEPTTTTTKARPERKPAHQKPTSRPEPTKRSSKHAPMEVTSKKPVSRKRDIISDTRPKARDPRFDPLSGPLNEARFKKAYAFLDSYRDDEIKQLRETVKKTKDPAAKEDLKRQLKSMEGKRETERKRAEEEKVLEEHKKKEKELVKQGKNPFYLKKAEQKKRLLEERFKGMSKGQVERAIVRRRKKDATKDWKEFSEVERASGARASGRRG